MVSTAHPLFYAGLILLAGYGGGRLAGMLNIPKVTGYLVTGILLGPSLTHILPPDLVRTGFKPVTELGLAVIAFFIGGSLDLSKMKRLGRHILIITLTQAAGAFALTSLVLLAVLPPLLDIGFASPGMWNRILPVALILGSISAATAPAAILAIIHQYGARGPLTSVLLGVVALDDGLTLIFFSFTLQGCLTLIQGTTASVAELLVSPIRSVLMALFLGGVLAAGLARTISLVERSQAVLGVTLGAILLTFGAAASLEIPELLAVMCLGFMTANFVPRHDEIFTALEGIEEPVFSAFFLLAGAHLDLGLLRVAGGLALAITVGRFLGKLFGSRIGARISSASTTIRNNLGPALLPTAGVTVGLALEAEQVLGLTGLSGIAVSGVLGSVVLNELITPFAVRAALARAGEIPANGSPLEDT
jgi:Kef-type K+ transport system membrane component KefB